MAAGSLWCPGCLSPIPADTVRCPVCGADPRVAPSATLDEADGGAPGATGNTEDPAIRAIPAADGRLAWRLEPPSTGDVPAGEVGTRAPTTDDPPTDDLTTRAAPLGALASAAPDSRAWLLPVAGLAVGLVGLGVILIIGFAASAAGWGGVAWPALGAITVVAVLAVLLQAERRWRALTRMRAEYKGTATPTDLDLFHLFAGRFGPATTGRDGFHPPLGRQTVRADAVAWRAVAATLLDLADRDVLELEPHTLPTPGAAVHVLAVRLVRPLPEGDEFARHLLHPLVRRGVGASTTAGDLVYPLVLMHPHPGRALLESDRQRLVALGYYHVGRAPAADASRPGPLAILLAVLPSTPRPDPERLASAYPALRALERRLAEWDQREPEVIAAVRGDVLAAFTRARAGARRLIA